MNVNTFSAHAIVVVIKQSAGLAVGRVRPIACLAALIALMTDELIEVLVTANRAEKFDACRSSKGYMGSVVA